MLTTNFCWYCNKLLAPTGGSLFLQSCQGWRHLLGACNDNNCLSNILLTLSLKEEGFALENYLLDKLYKLPHHALCQQAKLLVIFIFLC
jgi:hypothetical protein